MKNTPVYLSVSAALFLFIAPTLVSATDLPQPIIQFFHDPASGDLNAGTAIVDDSQILSEATLKPNPGIQVPGDARTYKKGAILAPSQPTSGAFFSFTAPLDLNPKAVSESGGLTVAFWMDGSKIRNWQRVLQNDSFLRVGVTGPESGSINLRSTLLTLQASSSSQDSVNIVESDRDIIDQEGWAFYTIVVPIDAGVRFYRNGMLLSEGTRPLFTAFDPELHRRDEAQNISVLIGGQGTSGSENDSIMEYSNLMIFLGALDDLQIKALFDQQFDR